MAALMERLDRVAGIEAEGTARLIERAAFVFLILMAVSAPHSIAATQTAWLAGMLLTALRFAFRPRPKLRLGAVDAALIAFVGWSVISAATSYEPAVSLDKLRGVGLFLILYFAVLNLRTMRAVRLAAFALAASCMVNVLWTPMERLIGRGVEIHGVSPSGPLGRAGLIDGDTILKVNGRRVSAPEEVTAALDAAESIEITYHRPDADKTVTLRREGLAAGAGAAERLGFESWEKNRKWRAKGFYGHFTTYSEVLQLVASLVLGFFLAGFLAWTRLGRTDAENISKGQIALLAAAFALISLAMLLSGTRASQLGLMMSGLVMVLAVGSRKLVIAAVLVAIPAAAGGYMVLQQTRQQDENNEYRKTMWRDGARLATESPRHLLVGVGMDSLKKRWPEFGLFDGGMLPMGHFHSTPIQLAAERGLPALVLWLAFIAILARTLWRTARRGNSVALGCLGGLAGFVTAGVVHYNLGDGEVAMVFYLLAGLGLASARLSGD